MMSEKEEGYMVKQAQKLIAKYEETDNFGMEADTLRELLQKYEEQKEDLEKTVEEINSQISEIEYMEGG